MKVLLCTYRCGDYGTDTLFDGLCRHLGNENVLEYPHKPTLHGVAEGRYPTIFDYPIIKTDEEKLRMVEDGRYDVILVNVRPRSAWIESKRKYLRDNFKEVVERNKNTPVVLIDQSDEKDIDYEYIERLKPKLYFKREYRESDNHPDFIKPLSFSYSEQYCPEDIFGPRRNAYFWAGQDKRGRRPFVRRLEKERGGKFFNKYSNDEFRRALLEHKIGLSLLGYGDDTVRYYEAPAHGALLLAEKPTIKIENDFTDGETAVFFKTADEMVEKIKYCAEHEDFTDRIRLAGHEWFKKYHTTRKRARQMVQQIEKII